MSDYTKTTNFTAKDSLSVGDPLKTIKGSYFDTEFDNLATAIATKYDSGNLASDVEAKGLTLNTVLLTPLRLNDVLTANAGILGDLQAVASNSGNGDAILFLDDTDDAAKLLSIGNGIEISGTTLQLPSSLAGDSLTLSSGVLNVAATLHAIAQLGVTANSMILANGSTWTLAGASTVRTALGMYTSDSPQFAGVNLSHASQNTLTGSSGQVLIEGKAMLQHSGSYTSGKITFSTSDPSGGSDGDIWFKYTA